MIVTFGKTEREGKKSHAIDDFGMMPTAHDVSARPAIDAPRPVTYPCSVCMVVAARNLELCLIYILYSC